VAGLAFVAIGIYDVSVDRDPFFDLSRFVIRLGYFSVATMLLAYLAQYQHGLFVDLARLATWPDSATDDERPS
jgi:hypothetical protein